MNIWQKISLILDHKWWTYGFCKLGMANEIKVETMKNNEKKWLKLGNSLSRIRSGFQEPAKTLRIQSPGQRDLIRVDGQAPLGQSFRHSHAYVAAHISLGLACFAENKT
jgi:hypothetical protein